MLVSILHRVTGTGLALVGGGLLVWWLVAAAAGADSYVTFTSFARSWIGVLLFVGLTWAFWMKTLAGIRHLVMDIGAGFELRTNKFWANMTVAGSVLLTLATWAYIFWRANS
jgi:succinate dehydrogenase / fumarate reductase cytochrome b subunit